MGFDEVCVPFRSLSQARLSCPVAQQHVCPRQIYLINLRRRPDRRERMLFSLNELEIDLKVVDAVDGK